MFETIQGSKLGLKLNKAFKGSDFKELTEEEFNNLSVTEQEEYKNKQEEIEDNMALQMEVLEEVLDFIVEALTINSLVLNFKRVAKWSRRH